MIGEESPSTKLCLSDVVKKKQRNQKIYPTKKQNLKAIYKCEKQQI